MEILLAIVPRSEDRPTRSFTPALWAYTEIRDWHCVHTADGGMDTASGRGAGNGLGMSSMGNKNMQGISIWTNRGARWSIV